tara:strand:- start:2093 stop:2635 length:543 start_codon:yes stop_codon:yes gene_type:complete
MSTKSVCRRPPTITALIERGVVNALEGKVLAHMRASIFDEERLHRALFGIPRGTLIASPWQAAAVFGPLLLGRGTEALAVALLGQSGMLLDVQILTTGAKASTVFDIPQILRAALMHAECASIIVAHNHPSGNVQPSNADIDCTVRLSRAVVIVGLNLHDSLVVTDGGGYTSLKSMGFIP